MAKCIDCGSCAFHVDFGRGLGWYEMDRPTRQAFLQNRDHNPAGQNPGTGHWNYVRCANYLEEWAEWNDSAPSPDALKETLVKERDCGGFAGHRAGLTPQQHPSFAQADVSGLTGGPASSGGAQRTFRTRDQGVRKPETRRPTDVTELIEQGEGQRVEFKQSFSADNEAIETVCSFANADGGSVLIGVSDAGVVVGASVGKNTLENFANKLHSSTDPSLHASLNEHQLGATTVVVISVEAHGPGALFYAFNKPYIRVGKTNQAMTSQEQRTRLLEGRDDWAEERDRPRFEVASRVGSRLENKFEPEWQLLRVAGDYVPTIEWRFRGARLRPPMEWRQVSAARLKDSRCSATFDLSQPPGQDELVPEDQIGIEVRFHWHGRFRQEIHRFSLTRAKHPTKAMWDVGQEILPPLCPDE